MAKSISKKRSKTAQKRSTAQSSTGETVRVSLLACQKPRAEKLSTQELWVRLLSLLAAGFVTAACLAIAIVWTRYRQAHDLEKHQCWENYRPELIRRRQVAKALSQAAPQIVETLTSRPPAVLSDLQFESGLFRQDFQLSVDDDILSYYVTADGEYLLTDDYDLWSLVDDLTQTETWAIEDWQAFAMQNLSGGLQLSTLTSPEPTAGIYRFTVKFDGYDREFTSFLSGDGHWLFINGYLLRDILNTTS